MVSLNEGGAIVEVIIWVLQHPWLVIGIVVAYVTVVGYVLIEIASTGDDHWIWIPFVLLLTFIAVPLYLIIKIKRAALERAWVDRQIKADEFKRSHNPRKLKTEAELVEAYYKSKAQKNR